MKRWFCSLLVSLVVSIAGPAAAATYSVSGSFAGSGFGPHINPTSVGPINFSFSFDADGVGDLPFLGSLSTIDSFMINGQTFSASDSVVYLGPDLRLAISGAGSLVQSGGTNDYLVAFSNNEASLPLTIGEFVTLRIDMFRLSNVGVGFFFSASEMSGEARIELLGEVPLPASITLLLAGLGAGALLRRSR